MAKERKSGRECILRNMCELCKRAVSLNLEVPRSNSQRQRQVGKIEEEKESEEAIVACAGLLNTRQISNIYAYFFFVAYLRKLFNQ